MTSGTNRTAAWAAVAVVTVVLGWVQIPVAAHEGHTHSVMGIVTAHQGQGIEVKTADGKTVAIALNEKTAVVRGTAKATAADVAVGQRVVVDIGDGKAPVTARQIKLGAAKMAPADHATHR